MNYRAKDMGFDATRLFEERLTKLIERTRCKMIDSSVFQIGPFAIRWYAILYRFRPYLSGIFGKQRSS